MSTTPVSPISLNQEIHQYFQTRSSDLQQLGQDLQAGNTSAAQSDFNNIVTLGQTGPLPNGEAFLLPNRQSDFNNIGTALQNGNLSGAQQAYTQLEDTFQQHATAPIQTGSGSSSATGSAPEIVLNVGGGNSTTPEQVTINISNAASGGGEQVSLSVGNQGSNAQQVTFNLGANTNEEIVLNLLGAGASSTGSSSSGSNLSVSA